MCSSFELCALSNIRRAFISYLSEQKINLITKLSSLFFNVVPLIVTQLVHFVSNDRIPSEKIFGVKVACYRFPDCIVIGKSSPTQKFFKVSEEKVVTGSQVWTVERMVKL